MTYPNTKGRLGKTTSAINLDAALARHHDGQVLVIDHDGQPSAVAQDGGLATLLDHAVRAGRQAPTTDLIYGPEWTAHLWTDPHSGHRGPTLTVTTTGVLDPEAHARPEPVFQRRLLGEVDTDTIDADGTIAAAEAALTALFKRTGEWTADDLGWRATVVRQILRQSPRDIQR
ncbi:AAA family ATPase [Nocardia sp. NPDC058176]|uniref:AAA family ATPase n=1 Tax=Nocardia sp. NPDC058176 TaxID=3346368 RepID=UPI0036DF4799